MLVSLKSSSTVFEGNSMSQLIVSATLMSISLVISKGKFCSEETIKLMRMISTAVYYGLPETG